MHCSCLKFVCVLWQVFHLFVTNPTSLTAAVPLCASHYLPPALPLTDNPLTNSFVAVLAVSFSKGPQGVQEVLPSPRRQEDLWLYHSEDCECRTTLQRNVTLGILKKKKKGNPSLVSLPLCTHRCKNTSWASRATCLPCLLLIRSGRPDLTVSWMRPTGSCRGSSTCGG